MPAGLRECLHTRRVADEPSRRRTKPCVENRRGRLDRKSSTRLHVDWPQTRPAMINRCFYDYYFAHMNAFSARHDEIARRSRPEKGSCTPTRRQAIPSSIHTAFPPASMPACRHVNTPSRPPACWSDRRSRLWTYDRSAAGEGRLDGGRCESKKSRRPDSHSQMTRNPPGNRRRAIRPHLFDAGEGDRQP